MSRSKKPPAIGKCFCGRGHVPYLARSERLRGRKYGVCPVLEYPHRANEMFLKQRELRSLPLEDEDQT